MDSVGLLTESVVLDYSIYGLLLAARDLTVTKTCNQNSLNPWKGVGGFLRGH